MMKVYNAVTADVEEVYQLIKGYATQEIVLPRSLMSLYQQLQSMYVVKDDGKVVGVACLHVLGRDLAEVRSLVVDPTYQGRGVGKLLIERLCEESPKLGIERLIALTYQVDFFLRCGFEVAVRENLPEKIWTDCIHCPKINNCDEVAMMKYVNQLCVTQGPN